MEKRLKIVLIIVGIILLVIVLYPKEIGYGYSGETTMDGLVLTRAENSCLGIFYWDRDTCVDCTSTKYCVGVPYGKKCYSWTVGNPIETEKQIPCGK